MYTKHFGYSIVAADSLALVKVIESIISNNYQNVDWNALTETMDMTLSKSFLTSTCDEYNDTLLLLWNSCVR